MAASEGEAEAEAEGVTRQAGAVLMPFLIREISSARSMSARTFAGYLMKEARLDVMRAAGAESR